MYRRICHIEKFLLFILFISILTGVSSTAFGSNSLENIGFAKQVTEDNNDKRNLSGTFKTDTANVEEEMKNNLKENLYRLENENPHLDPSEDSTPLPIEVFFYYGYNEYVKNFITPNDHYGTVRRFKSTEFGLVTRGKLGSKAYPNYTNDTLYFYRFVMVEPLDDMDPAYFPYERLSADPYGRPNKLQFKLRFRAKYSFFYNDEKEYEVNTSIYTDKYEHRRKVYEM